MYQQDLKNLEQKLLLTSLILTLVKILVQRFTEMTLHNHW
jgi:hypothetical protein